MTNLSKMLVKGNALARAGDIAGARAVFEHAASKHADNCAPWISLSAIHGMLGNFTDAMHCARRATEIAPNSLQGWVNLGNAAKSCGDFIHAVEAFQHARDLPGCPPGVDLDLGLVLAHLGKWAEAEKPLREYHERNRDDREGTLALARVLASMGDTGEADSISEAYCRRHPGDAQALIELGGRYFESARVGDAWRVCERAINASPNNPDALFFKAMLLRHDGRAAEARDILEKLDRAHPGNPRILMALCEVCSNLSDPDAGIAYAHAVLKLDPENLSALLSLSAAMIYRNTAEAWKYLNRAISISPHDAAIPGIQGELLGFEGNKLGAWDCVRPAIEKGDADIRSANVAAAVAPAIGKTDETIAYLERLADQPGLSQTARSVLRFSLADLCDKARQFDRAFGHAVIANKLKNVSHDDNALLLQVNRLKAVYSADAIASLPRSTNRSELPIFIVGMPRSGTSLLEQILSCHGKIHARGETSDIPTIVQAIPYFPDGVRDLTQEGLDALAETHIKRISEAAPDAMRITDKLPGNFLFLGIISQLFPGARVLNCQRDPRDVCLSNFMTDFGAGHQHSYNLESLARTCKIFQELMEHWRRVLSLPILDVRYEEVTADPRAQVGKILDFCGLEWEEACLSFHQSKRQVMTASYDQVRETLHTRSVARWKNYAQHLGPAIRILGLHDDTYP